ncbi:EAL domain-containing protein [Tepidiphilus baoligensis]|uniref:EAL domain-containing protein n=1 Tax=Tepidiphilus baoligensis TaxID=2698687 RepID=A0ABX1QNK9_9PROT|nr:EAL domain-containing protein [Tepidiphilus baoligensis]NMH17483.1 EAL domain-containing protein [Tepidiphilus baoligensis]
MILPDQPLTEAKLLVVDDNPANLDLLKAILDEAGFTHVTCLSDSRQVLPTWREGGFDLVLLDIRMPHLDGYTVMAQLEAELEDDHLPVIVLTAQFDELTRERALAAGARDFITKPFDAREVIQRIRNHLEVRALHNRHLQEVQALSADVHQKDDLLQQRERDLAYLATHHPLVGLTNRPHIMRRLESLLEGKDTSLGLLVFEIEGHRRLESLAGYEFTDQALQRFGERLHASLPPKAELGYWGSDIFIVLLPRYEGQELEQSVHNLLRMATTPLEVEGYPLTLSVRSALVRAPQDGEEAKTLLRRAMLTLSQARPGLLPMHFDLAFERSLQERESLLADLYEATLRGELQLVYQPKVSLVSGKIVGVEALMRWHHPRLGIVSPLRFIPLAEESGLITEIGLWAVERALAAIDRWHQQVGRILPVAVNLSPRQIDLLQGEGLSLSAQIHDAIERSGLPPSCLELELTESSLMQQNEAALQELQQLRQLGVSLALDDFGTGYSSMARLQTLPVSTLKIDRSLLQGVTQEARSRAILGSVIALGWALSLDVVAEGIETAAEAEILRELGCPLAQGFHFFRPLSETEIVRFL